MSGVAVTRHSNAARAAIRSPCRCVSRYRRACSSASAAGPEMVSAFFFQAEDGIRGGTVTGVQTCALPIYLGVPLGHERVQADVGVQCVRLTQVLEVEAGVEGYVVVVAGQIADIGAGRADSGSLCQQHGASDRGE